MGSGDRRGLIAKRCQGLLLRLGRLRLTVRSGETAMDCACETQPRRAVGAMYE